MRIFARYRRLTGRFARAAEDCQPRDPGVHNAGPSALATKTRASARNCAARAIIPDKRPGASLQYQAPYLRSAASKSVPTSAAR